MKYLENAIMNSHQWWLCGLLDEFGLFLSLYNWKEAIMSCNFTMVEDKHLMWATGNFTIVFINAHDLESDNWYAKQKDRKATTAGLAKQETIISMIDCLERLVIKMMKIWVVSYYTYYQFNGYQTLLV